jgi:hypothetical protein
VWIPWVLNVADANLNSALAMTGENRVVFELQFQEDCEDFMDAFSIAGASVSRRMTITATCPSVPVEQCTQNHTLCNSE